MTIKLENYNIRLLVTVIGLTVIIRILSLSSACISTVYKRKILHLCFLPTQRFPCGSEAVQLLRLLKHSITASSESR